jgi:hypothetical protein
MTLSAYIGGVGVLGPGLPNWAQTASVLCGEALYAAAATVLPPPILLPAAERRRTGRVVKLALAVACEAATNAGVDPASLASVFSSSGGDGHNCHALCEALATDRREVSPTRFSNSVHNAAAGYWSIATGATLECNVLCAFDASFGAGVLEAMTQVCVDGESLLLVTYDTDYPQPIHAQRPVPDAFGVALVLTSRRTPASLARIEAVLGHAPPDTLSNSLLEGLRVSTPAARSLPLLRRLARREAGSVVIDYLDALRLIVHVAPCTRSLSE